MTTRFECPRCQTVFTRDKGDDDAVVDCPSCGAMAMNVGEATDGLARNLTGSNDPTGIQPNNDLSLDDDEDSGVVNREASLVHNIDTAGIFAGLLAVPEPSGPTPVAPIGGIDLGLDEELGDFQLPATSPGNPALSPAKKTVGAKKSTSSPPSPAPAPRIEALPADVGISLGDDALDALGAAFDSMAARPTGNRGKDGLTDRERDFLGANAPKKAAEAPPMPPRKPPPRPPGKPGERRQAPPPRISKRARAASTGLSISAEAREAAFIPLKAVPSSSAAPETAIRPRARREAKNDDKTEIAPMPTAPASSSAAANEGTDLVTRPGRVVPREKPSVFGGISKLALAAVVVVGIIGGAAAGAATAPAPVKRNDARGRAEQQLADGNRFYQVGRFDDALASYKAALNHDRAYAIAHRAKGAALANKQRYDEAAEAYRDYLALEPQAIDAADIKEALKRRDLSPVAGGTGER